MVTGANSFAFDLYGQLKATPGNLFFSPYSISTCLAMAYAGARGETEKQMAQVLHVEGGQAPVHAGLGEVRRQLSSATGQRGVELEVANALWAQQGHPFIPPFLRIVRSDYDANVHQADFKTAAAPAISEINDWIAKKTGGHIKDLLSPESVNADTRLVLANAIYFKGSWAVTFPASQTSKQPFHVDASTQADASLMNRTGKIRYMETGAFQAVELPYQGDQITMVILLPRAVDGCGQLESELSPKLLSQSLDSMKAREVDLYLPKFEMSSRLGLDEPLQKLGMVNAFGPEADFSAMDGMKDLFISAVIHDAWVDVNEKGTEAAAATVATMSERVVVRQPTPVVFRADHPFVFLIRDTQSGMILFLGRLTSPGK